jgi:PAS domain S-box-containing protein
VCDVFPGGKQLGLFEIFQQVWKTGKAEFYPISQYEDDRLTFWAENYIYKLPSGEIVAVFNDVTERNKAEETLRASEGRYRAMMEQAADGVIVHDETGRILDVNRKTCQSLGYSREELLSKSIGDIDPDAIKTGKHELWDKILAGEQCMFESRQMRKDGSSIPVEVTLGSVHLPLGPAVLGIIRDITDRERVEEELRASERKFRDTVKYLDEGYYIVTPDGQLLEHNLSFNRILGFDSAEDLKGIHLPDFWQNPDDRNEYLNELVNKGFISNYLINAKTISGEKKVVLASAHIVKDQQGKLVGIEGAFTDFTDRKHAEEQILRQSKVLAAINSVFYETMVADSEKAVAMTCLKVAQEITGSKFGFIGEITPEGLYSTTALSDPGWDACRIPETQASMLIKDMVIRGIWGQVILKEQSLIVNDPISYPDRVGIPEGHPPLTSFLGVPLKDQGKVIGMIAMANRESGYTAEDQYDMETICVAFVEAIRRKKTQEEIRKLNTELEQRVMERTAQLSAANKEMEAFAYSVSHDLRAPLRSIDGFSQALLEEYETKLDETGKAYLKRVRKATQKMGFLIDDMLKLSRVSRAEFNHETVDLSAMIREITEAHRKIYPERVVDVRVQEGVMVQGDPYMMKIVLENLMDNAWKFTGKTEHPRIEFGTTVRDGKTACFIRDNGAGFDMAYVNKLFGAFQRLHTTHEFPGTGIGLATVKRIIARHGGQVWAEGEIGKGATFYFTLPS